ncbi:MAG: choice-of-anchor Q domain-containing protein [Planctomycetota bacterium]
MPRWISWLQHQWSLHVWKERVRSAMHFAIPRLSHPHDVAPPPVDALEPRLLFSGSIDGNIQLDNDPDGILGTTPLPAEAVVVFLDADQDGQLDAGETQATTDALGQYDLGVLADGTHRVQTVIPAGYQAQGGGDGSFDVVVSGQDVTTDVTLEPVDPYPIGVFSEEIDFGTGTLPGDTQYDAATGVYTVEAGGSDIWNKYDYFHYARSWHSGDGVAAARVVDLENTDQYAKAGIMFRDSSNPKSANVFLKVRPDGQVALQRRAGFNWSTETVASKALTPGNRELRLERAGELFTAFYKDDIGDWQLLGATTVSMAQLTSDAWVGLATTSHDNTQLATVVFDQVAMPWSAAQAGDSGLNDVDAFSQNSDIGAPAVAGQYTHDSGNGLYVVEGGGANIGGVADEFQYVYGTHGGDGAANARIAGLENTNNWAKAGVMFRASDATDAPYVFAMVRPDGDIQLRWRSIQGGATETSSLINLTKLPREINLHRVGDTFYAHYLGDTGVWQDFGRVTIEGFAGSALVGLAVNSNDPAKAATAVFDRVGMPWSIDGNGSLTTGPFGVFGEEGTIGGGTLQGDTAFDANNDVYTLEAAGQGIGGKKDFLQFARAKHTGDIATQVRVVSLENTNPNAKAGVMIRHSSDYRSPMVFLYTKPDGTVELMRRMGLDWQSQTVASQALTPGDRELRLERTGELYVASYKDDNGDWQQLATTTVALTTIGASPWVGLAASSQDNSQFATAVFDQVAMPWSTDFAPTVASNASAITVFEGTQATMNGTFGDPNGDAVTLAASVGTVVDNGDGTWTWTHTPATGPDDSQTVTVTATDANGNGAVATFDLVVNDPSMTFVDGQVNRDYWTGIGGTNISDLTGSSAYPLSPTGSDTLTSLQAVSWNDAIQTNNWAESYGQRISGYLVAPETGDYTFWISSDDKSQFWLSTDETAGNKAQLINLGSHTAQLEWDRYASQQSATVTLQAGQSYYLEVLHKEGGGGDHLAVGWRTPSDGAGATPTEIVPGEVLSTYAGAQIAPESGLPANLVVSTTVDEDDGDYSAGDLSLREAVAIASTRSGVDTITFDVGLTAGGPVTIDLATGLGALTIDDELQMLGPGAGDLTLNVSTLTVTADTTVSGLTVTGGTGSIFSLPGAMLTLDQVALDGDLALDTSWISGSQLTATDSTFSNKYVSLHYNSAHILLERTTFDGAYLSVAGASLTAIDTAFINYSGAAAALNIGVSASARLENVTISGNSSTGQAAGMMVAEDTSVIVVNSTIADNHADTDDTGGNRAGGIYVRGAVGGGESDVTLHNTIVSGNYVGSGTQSSDLGWVGLGETITASHSLIGVDDTTSLTDGVDGNIVGVTDPLLAPLNTSGGTAYHAPLANSPARDAGDNALAVDAAGAPLATDQRGQARIQDGTVDIGAVENAPPTVTTNAPSVTVDEGAQATVTVTASDPSGIADIAASIGDLTDNNDGTWNWTYDTTDGPADSQIVTITATDTDGAISTANFDLIVVNLAPNVISQGVNSTGPEGLYDNAGIFVNASYEDADQLTITVDWGDGNVDVGGPNNTPPEFAYWDEQSTPTGWSLEFWEPHAYAEPGTYHVTVTASDGDGGQHVQNYTVTATNVAPDIAANAPSVTVDEGTVATMNGTFSDPGGGNVGLAASVGEITDNSDGTWTWTYTPPNGSSDSQTVTLTATDSDSASVTATFDLVVNDVVTGPLPSIADIRLANDDGVDPADEITSDPTLAGELAGDSVSNVVVEFDHDGDGIVEGTTVSDASGAFTYTAFALTAGPQTIAARVQGSETWSTIDFDLVVERPTFSQDPLAWIGEAYAYSVETELASAIQVALGFSSPAGVAGLPFGSWDVLANYAGAGLAGLDSAYAGGITNAFAPDAATVSLAPWSHTETVDLSASGVTATGQYDLTGSLSLIAAYQVTPIDADRSTILIDLDVTSDFIYSEDRRGASGDVLEVIGLDAGYTWTFDATLEYAAGVMSLVGLATGEEAASYDFDYSSPGLFTQDLDGDFAHTYAETVTLGVTDATGTYDLDETTQYTQGSPDGAAVSHIYTQDGTYQLTGGLIDATGTIARGLTSTASTSDTFSGIIDEAVAGGQRTGSYSGESSSSTTVTLDQDGSVTSDGSDIGGAGTFSYIIEVIDGYERNDIGSFTANDGEGRTETGGFTELRTSDSEYRNAKEGSYTVTGSAVSSNLTLDVIDTLDILTEVTEFGTFAVSGSSRSASGTFTRTSRDDFGSSDPDLGNLNGNGDDATGNIGTQSSNTDSTYTYTNSESGDLTYPDGSGTFMLEESISEITTRTDVSNYTGTIGNRIDGGTTDQTITRIEITDYDESGNRELPLQGGTLTSDYTEDTYERIETKLIEDGTWDASAGIVTRDVNFLETVIIDSDTSLTTLNGSFDGNVAGRDVVGDAELTVTTTLDRTTTTDGGFTNDGGYIEMFLPDGTRTFTSGATFEDREDGTLYRHEFIDGTASDGDLQSGLFSGTFVFDEVINETTDIDDNGSYDEAFVNGEIERTTNGSRRDETDSDWIRTIDEAGTLTTSTSSLSETQSIVIDLDAWGDDYRLEITPYDDSPSTSGSLATVNTSSNSDQIVIEVASGSFSEELGSGITMSGTTSSNSTATSSSSHSESTTRDVDEDDVTTTGTFNYQSSDSLVASEARGGGYTDGDTTYSYNSTYSIDQGSSSIGNGTVNDTSTTSSTETASDTGSDIILTEQVTSDVDRSRTTHYTDRENSIVTDTFTETTTVNSSTDDQSTTAQTVNTSTIDDTRSVTETGTRTNTEKEDGTIDRTTVYDILTLDTVSSTGTSSGSAEQDLLVNATIDQDDYWERVDTTTVEVAVTPNEPSGTSSYSLSSTTTTDIDDYRRDGDVSRHSNATTNDATGVNTSDSTITFTGSEYIYTLNSEEASGQSESSSSSDDGAGNRSSHESGGMSYQLDSQSELRSGNVTERDSITSLGTSSVTTDKQVDQTYSQYESTDSSQSDSSSYQITSSATNATNGSVTTVTDDSSSSSSTNQQSDTFSEIGSLSAGNREVITTVNGVTSTTIDGYSNLNVALGHTISSTSHGESESSSQTDITDSTGAYSHSETTTSSSVSDGSNNLTASGQRIDQVTESDSVNSAGVTTNDSSTRDESLGGNRSSSSNSSSQDTLISSTTSTTTGSGNTTTTRFTADQSSSESANSLQSTDFDSTYSLEESSSFTEPSNGNGRSGTQSSRTENSDEATSGIESSSQDESHSQTFSSTDIVADDGSGATFSSTDTTATSSSGASNNSGGTSRTSTYDESTTTWTNGESETTSDSGGEDPFHSASDGITTASESDTDTTITVNRSRSTSDDGAGGYSHSDQTQTVTTTTATSSSTNTQATQGSLSGNSTESGSTDVRSEQSVGTVSDDGAGNTSGTETLTGTTTGNSLQVSTDFTPDSSNTSYTRSVSSGVFQGTRTTSTSRSDNGTVSSQGSSLDETIGSVTETLTDTGSSSNGAGASGTIDETTTNAQDQRQQSQSSSSNSSAGTTNSDSSETTVHGSLSSGVTHQYANGQITSTNAQPLGFSTSTTTKTTEDSASSDGDSSSSSSTQTETSSKTSGTYETDAQGGLSTYSGTYSNGTSTQSEQESSSSGSDVIDADLNLVANWSTTSTTSLDESSSRSGTFSDDGSGFQITGSGNAEGSRTVANEFSSDWALSYYFGPGSGKSTNTINETYSASLSTDANSGNDSLTESQSWSRESELDERTNGFSFNLVQSDDISIDSESSNGETTGSFTVNELISSVEDNTHTVAVVTDQISGSGSFGPDGVTGSGTAESSSRFDGELVYSASSPITYSSIPPGGFSLSVGIVGASVGSDFALSDVSASGGISGPGGVFGAGPQSVGDATQGNGPGGGGQITSARRSEVNHDAPAVDADTPVAPPVPPSPANETAVIAEGDITNAGVGLSIGIRQDGRLTADEAQSIVDADQGFYVNDGQATDQPRTDWGIFNDASEFLVVRIPSGVDAQGNATFNHLVLERHQAVGSRARARGPQVDPPAWRVYDFLAQDYVYGQNTDDHFLAQVVQNKADHAFYQTAETLATFGRDLVINLTPVLGTAYQFYQGNYLEGAISAGADATLAFGLVSRLAVATGRVANFAATAQKITAAATTGASIADAGIKASQGETLDAILALAPAFDALLIIKYVPVKSPALKSLHDAAPSTSKSSSYPKTPSKRFTEDLSLRSSSKRNFVIPDKVVERAVDDWIERYRSEFLNSGGRILPGGPPPIKELDDGTFEVTRGLYFHPDNYIKIYTGFENDKVTMVEELVHFLQARRYGHMNKDVLLPQQYDDFLEEQVENVFANLGLVPVDP